MSVPLRVAIVAVGALLIVLGLGALALVRSNSDPQPSPGPSPSPTASQTQQLLLVQVLDEQEYAADNLIVGTQPPDRPELTTILTVPASLLVPAGDDTITLGMTPSVLDTLAGIKGIEGALHLTVNAGLRIDRLAFAGLVDGVDGVWLFVPSPVTLPAKDGGEPRVISPGWQRMEGVVAADYALARVPGESAQDRRDRFAGVLEAALYRLPDSPERMRQLVTSLGSMAQSTVPTEELVPFLLQVRHDLHFRQVERATLPVEVIREGIRPASVPAPEADALLDDLFPDARVDVTG